MTPFLPGVWRIAAGTPETPSPVGLREFPPAAAALAAMPAVGAPHPAEAIRIRTTARGTMVAIPLAEGEELYGLGLQLKSVAQRGKKKTLRVNSDPIADTGDSHAPVPFIASTAGWGLVVDTARYATFYVGSIRPAAELRGAVAGGAADSTDELYKAGSGGRRELVIEIQHAAGVELYLFGGPTLKDVVARYNLFSGGGCRPALWGLGTWYRAYGKATGAEIEQLAAGLRADRIPCDVLGLEPGWQTAAYPCSFVWAAERFPQHRGFLDRMHAAGFRVNCWEHAFTHETSPLFPALKPHAGESTVFNGLVPDFLVPAARAAFTKHHETLAAEGIDGFKLDECDGSDFINWAWSFPEHDAFPSGLDGERMHSLLGILYQRAVLDVYRARGVRSYHSVRNSHLLAGPYPFVLYSDLYDLKDFVRGTVGAGFSGLLWTPEVRDAQSVEELVRRVQAVALSPQALINAWYIAQPPWVQINRERNLAGEAMPGRAQATELVRAALELRMRLLPYLDAAFARYQTTGVPPVRALAMDWPDHLPCRTVDDQWLVGDELLFAPVFAGQERRKVVLPPGTWYRFDDGTRVDGGQTIEEPAPLERLLLYVRAGAVLPLANVVQHVARDTVFSLTVQVYGDGARACVLPEDDGETADGPGNTVTLAWDGGAGSLTRSGTWPGRRYAVAEWQRRG